MRIAFYAPMKPSDSDVPSGDRETARAIIRMLGDLGHEVTIASRLVTWRREPDPDALPELIAASATEAERLAVPRGGAGPDLFLTYHLYHKAPDWLGPEVSRALGIPYVVAEASRAMKRAVGPWADRFAAVDRALAAADAVAAIHSDDREGLRPVVGPERLHLLPPAVDAASFPATGRPVRAVRAGKPPVLLAVGMMRKGDKLASYRVLGEALSRLMDREWRLVVAGDGPARDEALAALPAERLDWRGAVSREDLPALHAEADLFVWPAVNEAYGMALLEAQSAGLPAVAARRGGVPDIVADGETGLLVAEGDAAAFAGAVAALLDDPARRMAFGTAAARRVRAHHDFPVVRERLAAILAAAARVHGARKGAARP